jgi:hypothetical protein
LTAQRFKPEASEREAPPAGADWRWLAGASLCGGIIAPVLLMLGLQHTQAATAAPLLNLEGVLTALPAWFHFHENIDQRIATGFFLISNTKSSLAWRICSAILVRQPVAPAAVTGRRSGAVAEIRRLPPARPAGAGLKLAMVLS